LLVVDAAGNPLERRMTITRLGAGVDATGTLSEAAMVRVVEALGAYAEVMAAHGVVRGRMACTSAVRDATNGAEFLRRASAAAGVEAELLDGQEEAALTYQGATAALPPARGPRLVVDVGGGSTELVLDQGGRLESCSLQLGCVRLTERCLLGDPPTAASILEARGVVAAELDRAQVEMAHLGRTAPPEVVGTAGTVATLVQLVFGLEGYERDLVHHQVVERAQLAAWIDRLSIEPVSQRRAHRGMDPGRADVLLGGLLVLAGVLDLVGADQLVSSEDDLLDGLVASLR